MKIQRRYQGFNFTARQALRRRERDLFADYTKADASELVSSSFVFPRYHNISRLFGSTSVPSFHVLSMELLTVLRVQMLPRKVNSRTSAWRAGRLYQANAAPDKYRLGFVRTALLHFDGVRTVQRNIYSVR